MKIILNYEEAVEILKDRLQESSGDSRSIELEILPFQDNRVGAYPGRADEAAPAGPDLDRPFEYPETCGEDYRYLVKGEQMLAGDEYFSRCFGGWRPISTINEAYDGSGRFRRKVEPVAEAPEAQEYRLLERGEVIQEGDEMLYPGDGWHDARIVGQKVNFATFRRRVIPADEPGYRYVENGETIKKGDELLTWTYGPWAPINPNTCSFRINALGPNPAGTYRVRRKL